MSKIAREGSLAIDVMDFGPIARATVDLRPMTVFIGPSNTGKSYLAILIYALHQFFSDTTGFASRRWRLGIPLFSDEQKPGLSDRNAGRLLDRFRQSLKDRESRATGEFVLTPDVADVLGTGFDQYAEYVAREIGRCFGVGETHALVRRGRAKVTRISLRRRMPDDSEFGEHVLTLGRTAELKTTVPAGLSIPIGDEAPDQARDLHRFLSLTEKEQEVYAPEIAALEVLSIAGNLVLPSAIGPLHFPAYYLPADRTGLMHAHSVVVSALIAGAPAVGLRSAARTPVLSGVLADFLEQLIEIDRPGRARRHRLPDLGATIERDVLGGTVQIDRSAATNYPRFTYRPEGWKDDLALANASSMVSELAPVVLYLRHLVRPGNVLIVEEPESHLHPAMQVAFTRQLAALVNAGIRVIVTTHSEWLLEELANIVRRSEAPMRKQDGPVGGKVALRADQVGAWLFEPRLRPKGSVVSEINLDDSGLYPTGYDAVAEALHNDWAELSSRLENGS